MIFFGAFILILALCGLCFLTIEVELLVCS